MDKEKNKARFPRGAIGKGLNMTMPLAWYEPIAEEAKRLGTRPSTLARHWLAEHMTANGFGPEASPKPASAETPDEDTFGFEDAPSTEDLF